MYNKDAGCGASWAVNDIVIPPISKKLWAWNVPIIKSVNETGKNLKVLYNLLIMNTGNTPISDVNVWKKIGKVRIIRGGNIVFDASPPSKEWYIERVKIGCGFSIGDIYKKPVLNFTIGSKKKNHAEFLNCSIIPENFSCDLTKTGNYFTGNSCKSPDGGCWWNCWFCCHTKWICNFGRGDVSSYLDEKNRLIVNFTSNRGKCGFYIRADYYTTEELWKNHQEHTLLLTSEKGIPWYFYRFTT